MVFVSNMAFRHRTSASWKNGFMRGQMERNKSGLSGTTANIKFGENLKGENKLIQDVTRPNALFLSAAAQHNHPQLEPIFSWFRSLQPININLSRDRFFHLSISMVV